MAEITQIQYKLREVAALMVKDQGLHEGLWMAQVVFGFAAINTGPNPDDLYPTAMVPVQSIGLTRVTETGPLTIDASVANPAK